MTVIRVESPGDPARIRMTEMTDMTTAKRITNPVMRYRISAGSGRDRRPGRTMKAAIPAMTRAATSRRSRPGPNDGPGIERTTPSAVGSILSAGGSVAGEEPGILPEAAHPRAERFVKMVGIAGDQFPRRAILQRLPDKPGKGFRGLPRPLVIGGPLDGHGRGGVSPVRQPHRVACPLVFPVAVEADTVVAVEGSNGPAQGGDEPLPSDDPGLPAVDDQPGPSEDEQAADRHEDCPEENRNRRRKKPARGRDRTGADTDQQNPEAGQEEGDPEKGEAPSPAFPLDDVRIVTGRGESTRLLRKAFFHLPRPLPAASPGRG